MRRFITLLVFTLSGLPFVANAVNLKEYGFTQDIVDAAKCVSTRMPASVTKEVALTYWEPTTVENGVCVKPRNQLPPFEQGVARKAFLSALSSCIGKTVTTEGLWGSMVADATSVIAAAGIRDSLSGESLLDKLNAGAHHCNPPDPKQKKKS